MDAEWEYAYRAGTTTAFYNGDITDYSNDPKLDLIGWYYFNSGYTTHPAAQKDPNDWGLYDMAGNVWEWTWDWYGGAYPSNGVTDPTGPGSGSYRVARGGSWSNDAVNVRAAFRVSTNPDGRARGLGFRLARTAP